MASWIGATPAQRFKQYEQPAAKKAIASNYKEKQRVEIAERIRALREQHAAAETDAQRRKFNRRIRVQIDEWRRVCAAWDRDAATAAA